VKWLLGRDGFPKQDRGEGGVVQPRAKGVKRKAAPKKEHSRRKRGKGKLHV